MDYEVKRFSRHCAETGRELAPGEEFHSVLIAAGADLERKDYSAEAWQGPPEGAIGWWKSQVPSSETRRMTWAPNDVLLQFFEELEQQADKQDMRYVLALLLVRRRVMRLDESEKDEAGREVMVLYCPRRDMTYRAPAVIPEESRIEAIQDELAQLLFGSAG
ncbi:MAG: hypothetical protein HUU20_00535 [Pirellulales bacterium]|nr:hypothetical protein [Pirellulales bacterium]